jgi:hypothetical protein
MKKIFTLMLIGSVVVCNSSFAQTQPSVAKKPKSKTSVVAPKNATSKQDVQKQESPGTENNNASVSPELAMKFWMNYMTPGEMHEMLAKFNGEWKEQITMWMTPGAPPTTSDAMCTNTMIMGNRYQESKTVSTFNGMPFEGTNTLGYDNIKKVFVSTWIDNMGTGIMYLEGIWDAEKTTIHFKGKSVEPMVGKELPVREEFRMVDDHNQIIEMYMTKDGKEFKTMEIKFTR